jgi:hypothetical protein
MKQPLKMKELRVALDAESSLAIESMLKRIKEVVPTIKVHPSQFVSFLVSDFYLAHFEKDKEVFIAEFFDSDSYYQAQRKEAKGQANFDELMAKALEQAQKYKSKKRRRAKSVSPEIPDPVVKESI